MGCKDQPLAPIDGSTIDQPPGLCEGGTVAFIGICTEASQCGTCECINFGHASVCTKKCTSAADCPAPSNGCNTTTNYCRP